MFPKTPDNKSNTIQSTNYINLVDTEYTTVHIHTDVGNHGQLQIKTICRFQ